VKPETTQADAPSGYEVGLEIPQAPNGATGLGTPPVRDVNLTLPEGTTISPAGANGMESCAEYGPRGINIEGPESEEIGVEGLERPATGHCPGASDIADVTATTPLLREQLSGHMFIATPQCGGSEQAECTEEDAQDGKLFGLYLELRAPNSGVIIKLKGSASVDPKTGRITASFDEQPQFPFSKLTVAMRGGARAPLANGQTCGAATSDAEVVPWSAPYTPAATPSDFFDVDWNGAGEACPGSAPFKPSFVAESTGVAATTGPFTLTLKRQDREQDVSSLSTTLPEGLLANISKVARCPEAQAAEASLTACPSSSQIGTATVAVGSGSKPYYVQGKVFFTGPYAGAPFGLSVVVPAVAGPFNLGDVLVRVALNVDPHTTQVTAYDPEPLPQMLDGVPLRLKLLNVTLENREFVLNPTSCSPTSITGTVHSPTGATAAVSSPFVASGCGNLAFEPTLGVSTEASSTKADGTGVKVKIAYPAGAEANIAQLAITFPSQLPVRLETLRKACPAATFEANPAACPAASSVGSAVAHTPILAQPLSGPVYLVSYGSAKFPDIVMVLQGEGVTVDVDGQSFVSSTGVLKVTFASVPDAPISAFETVLPAGPYSQFTSSRSIKAARASQCGEDLAAPVAMVAHDGARLTAKPQMTIAGCHPTVSVLGAHATASGVRVTVSTSMRGRLNVDGPGLRAVTLNNAAAGRHGLTLAFTAAGRSAVRAHRKLRIVAHLVAGGRRVRGSKEVAL